MPLYLVNALSISVLPKKLVQVQVFITSYTTLIMTHFSCKKAENQAIFFAPLNVEIFVTTKSSTKYVTLLNVGGN